METDKHNTQEVILETLSDIKKDIKDVKKHLKSLEERQKKLETKINQLTLDVDLVHKFQRVFGERLSSVEQFCVERPLRSSAPPPSFEE